MTANRSIILNYTHITNATLLYNIILYTISLTAVICDMPARTFVKIQKHVGYFVCDKYTQAGEYIAVCTTLSMMSSENKTAGICGC